MASSVIGALSVEISVDAKGVKKGIKAAGGALAIGGRQLRISANKWGKWATAAIAATAAVTAAVVKTNLDNIKELKITAKAADETVAAFQRGAFAAKAFGIEQEQYGDILKDVNDRIGDFLVSGAGPMVDFFETIGPKVNVTADSFKNLSGSQSLGLYINSLQKAGASQQEMTFFMEALASDATRLIPLFQDNAKAFNALTFEAKALGIGLSDIDVEKAAMASKSIAKSLAITEAFGQELTVTLAPIVAKVIDLFEEMAVSAGGTGKLIQKSLDGVIAVIGVFADGLHGVSLVFKTLEVAAIGFVAFATQAFHGLTFALTTIADGWIMIFNETIKAINSVINTGIKEVPLLKSSKFVAGVNEVSANVIGLVSTTNAELHELAMQGLPSDQIRNFADAAISEADRIATSTVAKRKDDEVKGDGITGGAAESSEAKRIREENEGILAALIEQGELKEETMLGRFAREQLVLETALSNRQITEETFAKASVALAEKSEKAKLAVVTSTLSAAIMALSVGGKKAHKIQKNLAILNAVIKGKEAAVSAFNAGMSVGGPWAPLVAATYAAGSIAQTAGMISSIKSGGKSMGGMSGGGGGGAGAAGGSAGAGGGQAANVPESRNISINIAGDGLMSTNQVRELFGQLNEALGDGMQLNISGES